MTPPQLPTCIEWAVRVVRVLGYILLLIGVVVILVGTGATLVNDGLGAFLWLFAPWNVANFVMMIVVIAPGLLVLKLAEKLKNRRDNTL